MSTGKHWRLSNAITYLSHLDGERLPDYSSFQWEEEEISGDLNAAGDVSLSLLENKVLLIKKLEGIVSDVSDWN